MKSSVLCYNLKGSKKGKQITMIFGFLGYKIRHVETTEYLQPIGRLAGLLKTVDEAEPYNETGFTDEMLVIHAASEKLMDQALYLMKKDGIKVELKAMVTPTNSEWTSLALHEEILREHQEMKELERKKKD